MTEGSRIPIRYWIATVLTWLSLPPVAMGLVLLSAVVGVRGPDDKAIAAPVVAILLTLLTGLTGLVAWLLLRSVRDTPSVSTRWLVRHRLAPLLPPGVLLLLSIGATWIVVSA